MPAARVPAARVPAALTRAIMTARSLEFLAGQNTGITLCVRRLRPERLASGMPRTTSVRRHEPEPSRRDARRPEPSRPFLARVPDWVVAVAAVVPWGLIIAWLFARIARE